jgi:hypothetical protein
MKEMPDTLGIVISWLDADTSITATVASTLTGYTAGDSWIRVVESPGNQILEGLLAAPRFDFNVYSETVEQARALAFKVQRSVLEMKGHTTASAVITKVSTSVTPFDFTDFINGAPRYVLTMEVFVRPN